MTTNKSPEQIADELAENCILAILRLAPDSSDKEIELLKANHTKELSLSKTTLIKTLNLKELVEDKVMMDWLEGCYDWQLRPMPETFICRTKCNQPNLRQAIKAAMEKGE